MQWNLLQLANAIYPLIEDAAPLEGILRDFERSYTQVWQSMMADKLGLRAFEKGSDEALIAELDTVLQLAETDMTIFYRALARIDARDDTDDPLQLLLDAYYVPEQLTPEVRARINRWLGDYRGRLRSDRMDQEARREAMNAVNPKYVLRMAQVAIGQGRAGGPFARQ